MADDKNLINLALDLGTTTLVGRLLGSGGELLAEGRCSNPQAAVAADIIRRLEAARAGRGGELQRLLGEGVGRLVEELRSQAGTGKERLAAAAIAANPGIVHLLAGEPVERLLFPPYRPDFVGGDWFPSNRFGLDLPCPVYLFPLVSGYVGGDLVAFLYGQQPVADRTLFIDIGTNAEMALFSGENWRVTSVAAGPAFEGGEIACGMARRAGAVEDVRVVGDRLQLTVVGGGAPRGVCGSGLVAAVAAAREGGLIDAAGTLAASGEIATNLARYLVETDEGRALRLYRDAGTELVLTQDDLRAFQLAKGAVRAGALCLLDRAGVATESLAAVVITGAFGTSLTPQTLKKVAILPENMLDKVRFAADGALAGVSRFLAQAQGAEEAKGLAANLRPYPLSGTPAFEKAFIAALDF